MRLYPDSTLIELVMEVSEAPLEPGPLDRELQVFQAQLQQLVVGQRGPRKVTRHSGWRPEELMSPLTVSFCSERGRPSTGKFADDARRTTGSLITRLGADRATPLQALL